MSGAAVHVAAYHQQRRVRVFWKQYSTWYIGTVREFDPVDDTHRVFYDDGDIIRCGEARSAHSRPLGRLRR